MNIENALGRELAQSRQAALVPHGEFTALIYGCGGIGSNAAAQAAAMGANKFVLVDMDSVGIENIWPGWFGAMHIDLPKVEAIKQQLVSDYLIDEGDIVSEHRQFANETIEKHPGEIIVVISSSDSLKSRELVWRALANKEWDLWIDGRMGGYEAQLYSFTSDDASARQEYNLSFTGGSSLPCGMKATSSITTGFFQMSIGHVLYKFKYGETVPFITTYDMRIGMTVPASLG